MIQKTQVGHASSKVKMRAENTVLLVVAVCLHVLLCFSHTTAASSDGSSCTAATYGDRSYTKAQDTFSVYGKVYMRLHCQNLGPGDHVISVEWIDAEGGLQRADNHPFSLVLAQDYSCFFTFKLMRKGTLLQMLSGRDFDDAHYGRWSVIAYLDNQEIWRNHFSFEDL